MNDSTEGATQSPLRVAVIGSGPSGFYAIQALFKENDLNVRVDLFDRLPTPFGLVRGGVAPDHQKIKNVVRVYNKVAADERFRFFGNVELGRDLHIDDLKERYHATILATGNESDRKLGIPGEDLEGVYSATEFVGWYNGHPDFQTRTFDLENAKRVLVIGNGNVAIDVARILGKNAESLSDTDITNSSLQALSTSNVQEVELVARRGPAQAAFSPKEIKELSHSDGCFLEVRPEELALDPVSQGWMDEHATKDATKNLKYLHAATDTARPDEPHRNITCRFLASPIEFLGEAGKLTGVVLEKNEIYLDERGGLRPRATGQTFEIAAQMAFKAIGYRGTAIPGVPFHERWGIIPNSDGRVLEEPDGRPIAGLYVVGWAKRGPTGLIGTNSGDSQLTIARLLEDLQSDLLAAESSSDVADLLDKRSVDCVSWEDWERLDQDEQARGVAKGKAREKYTSIKDMMDAIHRLRS